MVVTNFVPFQGQHCETTVAGNLLKHVGIELSEPMLFGLGEGLGFIYWDMRAMPFPFIGGRIKNQHLTENLVKNIEQRVHFQTTSSLRTAWKNVATCIEAGQPVGLQLDSYYLDYFTTKVHFAGHFVAMYGYDDTDAFLVDTEQQGGAVKTALANIEQARDAKGPMSARNLSYTIERTRDTPDLAGAVTHAIERNAKDFLVPPISNVGYKGIEKASKQITTWFKRSQNIAEDFARTAALMERGGTGGALFRTMYRDFLNECTALVDDPNLTEGYEQFDRIAPQWTEVSRLIEHAGATTEQRYLDQASEALAELAQQEKEAMECLARVGKRST